MPDVKLKRAAGELREKAQAERKKLEEFLVRQAAGELQEGETKLSGSEIADRTKEIDQMYGEAASMMEFDTLSGIMAQPADNLSPGAKQFQGSGGLREILAGLGQEQPRVFKGIGDFMRAVRRGNGRSETIDLRPLNDTQKVHMMHAFSQAARFQQGEPLAKDLLAGDEEGAKRAVQSFHELEGKTLVGDDTGSAGRGDYLVPTDYMAELLSIMGEEQQFINVARQVPMSRRTIAFPRLAQTTAADTRPVYSFAAITKIDEGAVKPEREPTFEQLVITAYKYAAYVEASDELLMDSIVGLAPVLVILLTSAIGYEYDRDGMRGSGTAEPWGFLNHACTWVQNRATANSVGLTDILGLEERFFGGGPNTRYLHHPSVLPKLGALASSNIIFWNRDVSGRLPGTLIGRPLVRTHKLPVLGTKGDLCLVDPGYYLAGNLQGMTVANSIHYKFAYDVTAWRALFRGAGTPWPAGLFSMESSGTAMTFRVSPFCVLGDVATS